MKKMFNTIFILIALGLFGNVLAQQDTVFYQFWVQPPGNPLSYSVTPVQHILEGESFSIPDDDLPGSPFFLEPYQGLYDALVGGTFSLDDGAINGNIKMDIFITNLQAGGSTYDPLNGEPLFLYFDIQVEDIATGTVYTGDDHFYFNAGKKFRFCLSYGSAFNAFIQLVGLTQGQLGFAYLVGGAWTDAGIQTVLEPTQICFVAEHLSKFGGGRSGLGATNSVEPDALPGVPEKFDLNQNYPNPFNPTTKIAYSVPEDGIVTLKVYNALGVEVTELVSGYHNSGNYEVTFDGTGLSSGIYFYELRSNNVSLTRKMMLLK